MVTSDRDRAAPRGNLSSDGSPLAHAAGVTLWPKRPPHPSLNAEVTLYPELNPGHKQLWTTSVGFQRYLVSLQDDDERAPAVHACVKTELHYRRHI